MLATPPQIGDFIRTRRPRAVIVTNARRFDEIGDIGDSALIYDFFAAKMLELRQDVWDAGHESSLAVFRELKLKTLQRSSAVIINGAKKQHYVDDWLEQAGRRPIPKAVVNMPVEPYGPSSYADGPVHVVIAGYIHPWSRPGEWAEAVIPFVRSGSIVLHLIVAAHWTGHRTPSRLPHMYTRLAELDGVHSHAVMEYDDFRRFMSTCHLSLDLFERNPERELAFVTRTAMALAGGLSVIHVPFTELSAMIENQDAGWLLDSHDHEGLTSALVAATEDRAALVRKQAGARHVAADFEPKRVTAPLDALLRAMA